MRINWLGVLIAAIVIFLLRYLWTAHFAGADWAHLPLRTVGDIQGDTRAAGLGLANALVVSAAMGWVIGRLRDRELGSGIGVGLLAGIGFAVTTVSPEYIWGHTPLNTFLVDAGAYVVAYVLAGAVLGATAPKSVKKMTIPATA